MLFLEADSKTESAKQKEKIHKRKICHERSKNNVHHNNNDSKAQGNENSKENDSACENISEKINQRSNLKRSKANCKTEEIHKLKSHCEKLIRTCTAASLAKLSIEDFKSMEGEYKKNAHVFLRNFLYLLLNQY